jgi:hypothetical protein
VYRTAVLAGLKCIADDWDALTVDEAPVSLWMRSDPEDESDADTEAVRLCRQGQALNPKTVGKGDRNPSHAVHFELSCPDGGLPEVDLSVFGTPPGASDDDVTVRKGPQGSGKNSRERLVFANTSQLVQFGKFRQELIIQAERADKTYHAYIFAKITRVSVTLFVVSASDGHEMATLEGKSIDVVLKDSKLLEGWVRHNGAEIHLMRLGQVARPEMLTKPSAMGHDRMPLEPGASSRQVSRFRAVDHSRPIKKLRKN